MPSIVLKPLPKKEHKDYYQILMDNAISAYEVFLSDTMALDYCKITGKDRSLLLENPEYKQQTKALKAKRYLDEIGEVEQLKKELDSMSMDSEYDIRDPSSKEKGNKEYKDVFNMKFKLADMRRELLNMTKADGDAEEANAVNVFFVPLTAKEFEALKITELNEGTEDTKEAFATDKNKEAPQAAKNLLAEIAEDDIRGGYKVNADGSVEDW